MMVEHRSAGVSPARGSEQGCNREDGQSVAEVFHMLLKFYFAALFAVRTQLNPGSVQRAMTHVVPVIEPCAHLRGGLQHSVAAGGDVRGLLPLTQRLPAVPGA